MAASTSEAVGDAAVAAVTALALPGVTVSRRKNPGRPEGASAGVPEVVVSVGEEGKTEYLTATLKLKTYPVAVTIITAGGQVTGDDQTVRAWRELIEKQLDAGPTWAALELGRWNQTEITNKAPFDPAALSKDFNYSMVLAEVQVLESRT